MTRGAKRARSSKMWKVVNKATNNKPKPSTYPDFIKTNC